MFSLNQGRATYSFTCTCRQSQHSSSITVATNDDEQEHHHHSVAKSAGALFYKVLASLTTVICGVLAYFSLADLHASLPYFLALAASSFIYIAVADLIPSLHKKKLKWTPLSRQSFT